MLLKGALLGFLCGVVLGHHSPSHKDGPCHGAKAMANFDANDIAGIWYDTASNYDIARPTVQGRSCPQNKFTVESNGDILLDKKFTDNEGDHTQHKKFTPLVNDTGSYKVYRKDADDQWIEHPWIYTFVAISGESFLEFACKEEDNQHYEFHRMRSRSNSISDEDFNSLRETARNAGDNTEFFKYQHDNCHYTLE